MSEALGKTEAPRPADLATYHEADAVLETEYFDGGVTLRYGGERVRYRAGRGVARLAVTGPRLAFIDSDRATPDVDLICEFERFGALSIAPGILTAAWSGRTMPDGGEIITYGERSADGFPGALRLELDATMSRGRVVHRPRPETDGVIEVGFPTDEQIVSRRLARRGGVLLHASSLLHDGAALLFTGHSGAGKSTTAMYGESAGATVLSDDRTIVTVDARGVKAWGTPWHGSLRRAVNACAPVAGLFVLEQSESTLVEPISAARALGESFVRIVHPTTSGEDVLRTLATLERIVEGVPCGILRQRRGPEGYSLARQFVLSRT